MEDKKLPDDITRIKALADKNAQTVEEFLTGLEEKFETEQKNKIAEDQSIGPQSENSADAFDPAGTEFLRGIWNK